MFRFLQRFGRDSQARGRGTGPLHRVRRRNHQLNCEALESRQLLSAYYIVNADSGKVLDNSLSTSPGTAIDQWQLYGGATSSGTSSRAAGRPRCDTKRAKRPISTLRSLTHGTQINAVPVEGGLNQQWCSNFQGPERKLWPTNIKRIAAWCSTTRVSTSNGTHIIQYPSNTGPNQQWILLAAGNVPAQSYNVQNAVTNLVLDDPRSSNSNGTDINSTSSTGGPTRRGDYPAGRRQ